MTDLLAFLKDPSVYDVEYNCRRVEVETGNCQARKYFGLNASGVSCCGRDRLPHSGYMLKTSSLADVRIGCRLQEREFMDHKQLFCLRNWLNYLNGKDWEEQAQGQGANKKFDSDMLSLRCLSGKQMTMSNRYLDTREL